MSKSILIVEDDPSLAELVRYNLSKEGFNALVVEDGETAVLAVEEEDPSLVILDWMLPNLSGIEVCRQLRRKPENRSLPIIMLTALGEETDRIVGLEVGADDYLAKPFNPRELLARIKAVLRRTGRAPRPSGCPRRPRRSSTRSPRSPSPRALRRTPHQPPLAAAASASPSSSS